MLYIMLELVFFRIIDQAQDLSKKHTPKDPFNQLKLVGLPVFLVSQPFDLLLYSVNTKNNDV